VETDYTGDSFCEKTIEKTILRVLGSSEFSHSLGHQRTSGRAQALSVLPPGTDIKRPPQHVRSVPEPDVLTLSGTETIVRLVRS